jgi:perosamine synthetase
VSDVKPIDIFRPFMSNEAREHAAAVLTPSEDGRLFIGQGDEVEAFEAELKADLRSNYDVLTTNSGTSALDLAMHLAGVGPGKFVISTPMTCSATNSPIITKWANVLWADVNPITGLIDPDSVYDRVLWCRRHLGRPPAAIVAVDWAGRLCDYPAIRRATQAALGADGDLLRVPIIQDAAHAYRAAMRVAFSDPVVSPDARNVIGVANTEAIKHLTTIDGGALICKTPNNVEQARLLRWYGLDRRTGDSFRCSQDIGRVGFKYHMNDVAASIGRGNLPFMSNLIRTQRANARLLSDHLVNIPDITLPPDDPDSSWWLYTILVDDPAGQEPGVARDDLIAYLTSKSIGASQVHRRNDEHPGFIRHTPGPMPLPGVASFASHEVAIPVGWWLDPDDITRIADAVKAWAGA